MQRIRSSKRLHHALADVVWAPGSQWNTRIVLQCIRFCGQQSIVQSGFTPHSVTQETSQHGKLHHIHSYPVIHGATAQIPQYFDALSKLNPGHYRLPGSARRLSSLVLTSEVKTGVFRDVPSSTTTKDLVHTLRHYGRCYWELSKARLSMLVVTTAGSGFVMGSGAIIDWAGFSWTCMGTLLIAAAANTINQILEVGNDSQMKRTMHRPLPAGRIGTQHAMAWAATAGIAGAALLASKVNMIAAGLGAANLVLYTLVYTPLKQVHPMNTWVGAVVGAIPPLLGWAAAAGEVGLGGWVLASALYFWQIPHFMAIAHLCRQDYAAGGFKMLSVLDNSGKKTALVALRNCGYLLPLGFIAHQCGVTTEWFGLETALLTAGMGTTAALFYSNPSTERARKLFRTSLLYLPVLMAAMLFHRRPNQQVNETSQENLTTKSFDAVVSTERGFPEFRESEDAERGQRREDGPRKPSRPPVAYLSVAPFPFLPPPEYSSS